MSSALEIMQVLHLLFHQKAPETDATYISPLPIVNDEMEHRMLKLAVRLHDSHQTKYIVFRREAVIPRMSYPGSATWRQKVTSLLTDVDRDSRCITEIPRTDESSTELQNLVTLALERGWKTVTVLSCAPFLLGDMRKAIFTAGMLGAENLRFYPCTPSPVDWDCYSPSLNSEASGSDLFGYITDKFGLSDKAASIQEVISHIRNNGRLQPVAV